MPSTKSIKINERALYLPNLSYSYLVYIKWNSLKPTESIQNETAKCVLSHLEWNNLMQMNLSQFKIKETFLPSPYNWVD